MPAKIGLKRDHALARAGCYFDSAATTCGVNAFVICGERGGDVRASEIVMLAAAQVVHVHQPVDVIASQAIQCSDQLRFVKRATRGNDVRTQYRGAAGAAKLQVVGFRRRN